ncbi:hypothetical protein L1281_001141 [Neisseria sp. HSC-16F19]|nr:hypothetical protein [Neisseria sp. HSC-16F19]MCP2040558.1 hypothetical protein [Neisseria sp. HSC-16F19]
MIGALLLGLWLFVTANREKQAFWESFTFTFIVMIIHYLMTWEVPEVNLVWLVSWLIRWAFVFAAMWLADAIANSMLGVVAVAVLAGAGFFFLDAEALRLATDWVG